MAGVFLGLFCNFFIFILFKVTRLTNYTYHKLQITMIKYSAMATPITTIYITYLDQVLLTYIRKRNKIK